MQTLQWTLFLLFAVAAMFLVIAHMHAEDTHSKNIVKPLSHEMSHFTISSATAARVIKSTEPPRKRSNFQQPQKHHRHTSKASFYCNLDSFTAQSAPEPKTSKNRNSESAPHKPPRHSHRLSASSHHHMHIRTAIRLAVPLPGSAGFIHRKPTSQSLIASDAAAASEAKLPPQAPLQGQSTFATVPPSVTAASQSQSLRSRYQQFATAETPGSSCSQDYGWGFLNRWDSHRADYCAPADSAPTTPPPATTLRCRSFVHSKLPAATAPHTLCDASGAHCLPSPD